MAANPVDEFVAAIESAEIATCSAFADTAEVDAVVPNWRFSMHGPEAIKETFGHWYADPGEYEELRRTPIPGGELVEFTLRWEEQGVPHAARQVHVIGVSEGKIVSDHVWCGGRWPESLRAEMAGG